MNPEPSSSGLPPQPAGAAAPRHTAHEWDAVRSEFCSSILADTPLVSLAQNLEGAAWPLTGPKEVPSAYLELTFDELIESLALRGQPPAVVDLLIDLLQETLAFDTPFGEMVTASTVVPESENPLVKNLAKLKIPADFPVSLTALSPDTRMVCELEKIHTVGELALAAQRMAGAVIVGGDFRVLLNALSNIDEVALARYLPVRPGTTGLHYLEGLAQGFRGQPPAVQAALARRLKHPLSAAAEALARTVTKERVDEARAALQLHGAALRGYCEADYAELQRVLATGTAPLRVVAVLGDPAVEVVVADLLAPAGSSAPKAGFWSRLFASWRK